MFDVEYINRYVEGRYERDVLVERWNGYSLVTPDGRSFHKVTSTLWKEIDALAIYFGVGRGADEFTVGQFRLCLMYVKVGAFWVNVLTGREVPFDLDRYVRRLEDSFGQSGCRLFREEELVPPTCGHSSRCEQTKVLIRIAEAMASSERSEVIYAQVVDLMAEINGAHQTHLHLLTADGESFVRYASFDGEGSRTTVSPVRPAFQGRAERLIKHRQPIVADYRHPHQEDLPPQKENVELGHRCAVSVPLVADDAVVGMITMLFREEKTWSNDDLSFLCDLGRVIGSSIRQILTMQKVVELRALEERKRLSSEIHDNISQFVHATTINADSALAAYDAGNFEDMADSLERLAHASRETQRVLRDEMLSLRAPLENTEGLVVALEEIIERFESHWGIPVTFTVDAYNDPLVVSTSTSLQLTRILNECLSNVLRHAQANSVDVSIVETNQHLVMTVADDGVGFDVDAVSPMRLGLKIMQERAASAGGKLSVESGPSGTLVSVDIPRRIWR